MLISDLINKRWGGGASGDGKWDKAPATSARLENYFTSKSISIQSDHLHLKGPSLSGGCCVDPLAYFLWGWFSL